MESLEKMDKRSGTGKGKAAVYFILIFVLILGGVGGLLVVLNERELPQISLQEEFEFIGLEKEFKISVDDEKSGIRKVEVFLRQNDKKQLLFTETIRRQGYFSSAGPNHIERTIKVETKSLGLEDGRAELVIVAQDFSFWHFMKGNTSSRTYLVTLDTQKPKIAIVDLPRYIKPGGASIVVYRVNESVESHGAMVNGHYMPGFPLPDRGEGFYGALLALSYDAEKISEMYVTAEDKAGNKGKTTFSMIYLKVKYNHDRIDIGDNFLNRKMPEFMQYYPEIPSGSNLEGYIYVNNELRRKNNETIRSVCMHSTPEKLWDGKFGRLSRSSRRSSFADYRTYYYQGKKIDQQVHLGIDLASVRHADVEAANNGKVVFADYLGIYGNMVILDHGMGLFSLYSHLSQIKVSVGDMVEKDSIIAQTGATGMAGGDHLHFGILVNGIFVNPLEWWDESWLKLNILNYL